LILAFRASVLDLVAARTAAARPIDNAVVVVVVVGRGGCTTNSGENPVTTPRRRRRTDNETKGRRTKNVMVCLVVSVLLRCMALLFWM
jgi:hypothetical protein